jgi:ribosomal subunit interface protein
MQILIEGKNLTVTEAIKLHATKQANKVLKLHKSVTSIRIFLETLKRKTNDPQANQVTYEIDIPGQDVVVKSHARDMYEAIVKATDAAQRKLRKLSEKQRDTIKKPRAVALKTA